MNTLPQEDPFEVALSPELFGSSALLSTSYNDNYDWLSWQSSAPDCVDQTWRTPNTPTTLTFSDPDLDVQGEIALFLTETNGVMSRHIEFSGSALVDGELANTFTELALDRGETEPVDSIEVGLFASDPELSFCDGTSGCRYNIGYRPTGASSTELLEGSANL